MDKWIFVRTGYVDSSILFVSGVHCRLEMITEEGTWKESHSFTYGGCLIERVKGEKVGGITQAWRQMRTDYPHMQSKASG